MRKEEQLLYSKLIEAVEGEDIAVSSNAAMRLVATLIVGTSSSLADAEAGAMTAAQQITEMVRVAIFSPSPSKPPLAACWRQRFGLDFGFESDSIGLDGDAWSRNLTSRMTS